jgi:hypothetical protein
MVACVSLRGYLIEPLLKKWNLAFVRLDGSVP